MERTTDETIEFFKEHEFFHGNKEYQFLYEYWKKSITKGLSDFINLKFFCGKKNLEDILLFLEYRKSGIKSELIKPGKKATELAVILDFHNILELTVFDKTVNNYTEVVNYFEFPKLFTESDIDYYLNVIRKPCFDYGLKFMRIEPRKIISYWDKAFNIEMTNKATYEDIFGENSENKEIKDRTMR